MTSVNKHRRAWTDLFTWPCEHRRAESQRPVQRRCSSCGLNDARRIAYFGQSSLVSALSDGRRSFFLKNIAGRVREPKVHRAWARTHAGGWRVAGRGLGWPHRTDVAICDRAGPSEHEPSSQPLLCQLSLARPQSSEGTSLVVAEKLAVDGTVCCSMLTSTSLACAASSSMCIQ